MRTNINTSLRMFWESFLGDGFMLNASWGKKRRTSRQTPTSSCTPKKEKWGCAGSGASEASAMAWNNMGCYFEKTICVRISISQNLLAEGKAAGLVLNDYRPYTFLQALFADE